MHICFITHEYPKAGYPHGGVGTFIKSLAGMLVNKGHRVSIVGMNYTEGSEYAFENGIHIFRLHKTRIWGFTWLLISGAINQKIREIHHSQPIDIVETNELGLAFIKKIKAVTYLIRLNGGHHFFAESENREIDKWKGFQEKRSFAKADRIFGVSEYVLTHTAKYIPFQQKKGPVIYNPANFSKFYEADDAKIVEGSIFFAGTVCEKKGIRQLILSLPLIKKQIPAAQLTIAGRDSKCADGTSYIRYLQQFISPEIKDDIQFLGAVSNDKIPALIEQAAVCVYPSYMEAMPLTWIEVMSMGKAFVGSKTGPGPELVKDGTTGLLCNPYKPEDIANKVVSVLSDKTLAKQLGKNARIDILSRFDSEKIALQNIEFYGSLILKESGSKKQFY